MSTPVFSVCQGIPSLPDIILHACELCHGRRIGRRVGGHQKEVRAKRLLRRELQNLCPQFDDLHWAIGPVIHPTDDEIALIGVMAMFLEIRGSVLEFDSRLGPEVLPRIEEILAFAIGEALLDRLDIEAKLPTDHCEDEDHALFVDGGVTQASEIYGFTVETEIAIAICFVERLVCPCCSARFLSISMICSSL
jgi:hypothetical protein